MLVANTESTYATYIERNVPLGDHIYMVCWIDEGGQESPDSNLVQVTIKEKVRPPVLSWIEPANIYITFDLGEEKTIGGVRAIFCPDAVETSADGINWTTVVYAITPSEGGPVEILFDEQTNARYVRVYETIPYPFVLAS